MAPISSSSQKPVDDDAPIEEIVFSCSICQATVSEVYATPESNQGFHSGSGDEDGIVTKMWITECSHVTCAKHLENGAAPFHPKGIPPRAPCPKCHKENGDETPKELYSIRGLNDGEYDSVIPGEWRQCPAIRLDSSIPGMSAVRFQYMALCHYSRQVRKHWLSALRKQSAIEAAYAKERKKSRQLQSELQDTKKQIEALQQSEVRLQKWEDRKPVITHYMNVAGKMAKDNEDMRYQLLQLGVAIPKNDYAFVPSDKQAAYHAESVDERHDGRPDCRTANGASYPNENSSSVRKRKRENLAPVGFDQVSMPQERHNPGSRDLMPPPLPRQKTEVLLSHQAQAGQQPAPSRRPIQIYEDGDCMPAQVDKFHKQASLEGARFHTNDEASQPRTLPYRSSIATYSQPQVARAEIPQFAASNYGANPYLVQATIRSDGQSQSSVNLSRPHQPLATSTYNPAHWKHQLNDRSLVLQDDQNGDLVPSGTRYSPGGYYRNDESEAPMKPPSQSHFNRLPSTGSLAPHSYRQSSSDYAPSAPVISVPSPFFRREKLAFDSRMSQRTAVRGAFTGTRSDASAHYDIVSHHTTPTTYAPQRNGDKYRSQHGVAVNGAQQVNLQRSYNPSLYFPEKPTQYRGNVATPQTPRNSQGLLQRSDHPPPPSSYSAYRPLSSVPRSRVSLPPNNVRSVPAAMDQDEALSMVPGIRGVAAHRDVSSRQGGASGHGDAQLFLQSAGGRRSVRR